MKKHKFLIALFTIFIVGLLLRLTGQSRFSPSLNWDEASLGYNAYSLLKSGADEWGVLLPSIFRAYGDFKLPLYIYLSILPIKLFGLNIFSVRFTSEIAGSLLILTTYLIARRLKANNSIALLAALLVAIEPWTLFISKIALEANLATLILSLGMVLLLRRRIFLAMLFFGLSVWTYNSLRIFTPLFLFSIGFYYHRSVIAWARFHFKVFLGSLFVTLLLIGTMAYQLFFGPGLARFNWISLIDSGAITRIENLRSTSSLPLPWVRLRYNRPVYFISEFSKNYFRHFLPNFLFINGGSQYQFNIPGVGLLYRINLPFFYLGLVMVLIKRHKYTPLLLFWLVLYPIAGSITRDSPHTLRAIPFLPLPMILSASGLVTTFSWLKKYWWLFGVAYFSFLAQSFHQYYFITGPMYRAKYSQSWQYGHAQLVDYLKAVYGKYDRIVITKKYGEPHEFILLNWPWDPNRFRTDPNLNRYFKSNWYWVDSFAKFQFVNDWEMVDYVSTHPRSNTLVVASPQNIPAATRLDQILFLDGQPAFILETQ
jgi:hypothetical protein